MKPKKILHLDLETTGTDEKRHGIVQIAQIIEIDGVVVSEKEWKLAPMPGDEITVGAIDVHRVGAIFTGENKRNELDGSDLTVQCINKQSDLWYLHDPEQRPAFAVWQEIRATWEEHINVFDKADKFTLAGYNVAAFDSKFLRAFILKMASAARYSVYGSFIESRKMLDLFPLLQWLVLCSPCVPELQGLPNLKLETVCEAIGIKLVKAHDALEDIRATRELTNRLIEFIGHWPGIKAIGSSNFPHLKPLASGMTPGIPVSEEMIEDGAEIIARFDEMQTDLEGLVARDLDRRTMQSLEVFPVSKEMAAVCDRMLDDPEFISVLRTHRQRVLDYLGVTLEHQTTESVDVLPEIRKELAEGMSKAMEASGIPGRPEPDDNPDRAEAGPEHAGASAGEIVDDDPFGLELPKPGSIDSAISVEDVVEKQLPDVYHCKHCNQNHSFNADAQLILCPDCGREVEIVE